MTKFKTLAMGTVAAAMTLAVASPAAAQYGYQQPYPQPYQAQPNAGQVVGAIINAVTGGYGQYPMGNYGYQQVGQRQLVQQCAIATEQRLNANYRSQAYRSQDAYGRPVPVSRDVYGRPIYAQNQSQARVLGVTSVERRANGTLRVRGLASSGNLGVQMDRWGRPVVTAGNQADMTFNCRVDARGRVLDVDLNRNTTRYRTGY